MSKMLQVGITIGAVIVLYLLILVVMPILADFASSANVTASTVPGRNVTADYPGAVEFLLAIPWILWFVPGSIGMAVIVLILLKRP